MTTVHRAAFAEKLEVRPAYVVVAEHIRREIRLGTYGAGDKLPAERLFAEDLGVSRVTLREAIRVLAGEGYLEIRRGATGGATVVDRRESPALLRARIRDGLDNLLATHEFRVVNEMLAAERAARRLSAEDLSTLEAAVIDIGAAETIGDFRRADSVFHLTIARAADLELLTRAVEDSRAIMFDSLDVLDFEILITNAVKGHRAILAGLAAGDPVRARRAMSRHLQTTSSELDAVLSEPQGSPAPR